MYLGVYAGLGLLNAAGIFASYMQTALAALRASRSVHVLLCLR